MLRLLGLHAGCGLHVFDGGDDLALLDVVAFFHVEVGDAAEGGGADVDIGLGLDLPGAADDRGRDPAAQLCRSGPWCSPTAA